MNNELTIEKTKTLDLSKKFYLVIKRGIDLVLSLGMLLILWPIFLIVAILIKLDSRGPVLFVQPRTGKNGKIFNVYKFRSMTADNDVHDFKKANEMTKMGKILRKTSLDELPQLFNVIKGEMSFIGPRPWIPDYFEVMNDEQRRRCDVRPGITGLAQASGRNGISIFEKINLDLQYIENISLFMDIKVIFLTVKEVFVTEEVDISKSGIKDELDDLKKQWR